MNATFLVFWGALTAALQQPIHIRNWTNDSGFIGDDFDAQMHGNSVRCDPPSAMVGQADFWAVWQIWEDYLAGEVRRHEIRDNLTRNSKYVISILHHFMEA